VRTAVNFLQNPKVRERPLDQRLAFLERRGDYSSVTILYFICFICYVVLLNCILLLAVAFMYYTKC